MDKRSIIRFKNQWNNGIQGKPTFLRKITKKKGTAKYPVSICTFLSLFLNTIGCQHSQYFFTLLKVFPRNDVRKTSTEI